jgi:hypothetical protein
MHKSERRFIYICVCVCVANDFKASLKMHKSEKRFICICVCVCVDLYICVLARGVPNSSLS